MDFLKELEKEKKAEVKKAFGKRLKELILASPYKQYQVAAKLKIEPPNVSRWVNGENSPSPENWLALKALLNIDESDFRDIFEPKTTSMSPLPEPLDLRAEIIHRTAGMDDDELRFVLSVLDRTRTGRRRS